MTFHGLTKKQKLYGVGGLIALAFLFFVFEIRWTLRQNTMPSITPIVIDASQNTVRHPLTGVWQNASVEPTNVFAVMIDEHEDARPQSGLNQAFLVVEAPVEAGIPRLLAFFDANTVVEKIGPVRSARPYFVDWVNEFDALYVHVGGSNEAIDKIVSGDTFDLNEFTHGSSFWRDSSRYAPYNTYTSSDLLNKFLKDRTDGGVAPDVLYESWKYKDADPVLTQSPLSSVSIDFWAPVYTVGWNFDDESGRYKRLEAGDNIKTREGDQIFADTVAIVVTDIAVKDEVGRRNVRTLGQGKAWVLQDGKVIDATWKKPSASQRLRFFDGDNEIAMNAGVAWIEIVPSVYDVTFEKE